MRIETIVFDLDGTLIDSTDGIQSALTQAFAAAGRTMPEADLRKIIGPPIRIIARRVEPDLTDAELAVIETRYRTLYDNEGWRRTVAYDAVADTLEELRARSKSLFIVTNKPRIPSQNILGHLGLDRQFGEVVTRDSRVPPYASKAEMLRDLAARHGLDSSTSLMVGDTAEDQEAAHANGFHFLHVSYGYGSAPGSRQISHFAEILKVLS